MSPEEKRERAKQYFKRRRAENPDRIREQTRRSNEREIMRLRSSGEDLPSPATLSPDEQERLVKRLRYRKRMQCPEKVERRRAIDREVRKRIKLDPVRAARRLELHLVKKRERYARAKTDPETMEKLRKMYRQRDARRKARDPEAFRAERRRKYAGRQARAKVRVELSQEVKLRALRRLIPSYLPPHARDDVLSDLTLAMLEGHCTPDKVRETIKKASARYSAEQWKELSLNAPVPGMDGVTFLDMLADQEG